MSLLERIAQETVAGQKRGDSARVGVLRFLSAQIKNREIELRGKGAALTDEEVLGVLAKEAKKRKEAIDLFTKGGRADLAAKEAAELEMISGYLPRQMTREEVEREVDALLAAEPAREFAALMRAAMARMKGRTDGSVVSGVIKSKIG